MMLDRVLKRLKEETSLRRVERDTGLSYSWLIQLKKGRFNDPGVKRIEALDSYYRARDAA